MNDGFHLDMSEIEGLAAALAESAAQVEATTSTLLAAQAQQVRADASARAPVLTGAQAAGYYVEDVGDGSKRVSNDTRESFYQELGTSVMSPQPALFPAAEAGAVRLVTRLEAATGVLL